MDLPKNQRLLGLDVGEKTIGLAICDPMQMVATPLKTIERKKLANDIKQLQAVIQEWEIAGLVIGLPIQMDGTEGPRCQSVRQFARNVQKEIEIAVFFQDERLSTSAMEREMIAADLSRQKRDARIDKLAAAWILQIFIDKNS